MRSQAELAQEYSKFMEKFLRASNDINNAIKELSPENLERFKSELKILLPTGVTKLLQELYR